jgi:hypothetical protein
MGIWQMNPERVFLNPSRFIKLSFAGFFASLISSSVIFTWLGPMFFKDLFYFIVKILGLSENIGSFSRASSAWAILAFLFLLGTLVLPLLYSLLPKTKEFYSATLKGSLFGLFWAFLITLSETYRSSNLHPDFTGIVVLLLIYGFCLGFTEAFLERARSRGNPYLP